MIQMEEPLMMTTGFNFEGYNIVKYLGVISAPVVLGTGIFSNWDAALSDFTGTEADLMNRN